MVQKINDEALDMAAIVVLIGHDHELSVPQAAHVLVVFSELKPHDLHDVLNFFILHNLSVVRLTNIQRFAFERENTVRVTANNGESTYSKGFGTIPFREDQRAEFSLCSSSQICIFEFGDASQLGTFGTALLFQLIALLELCPRQNIFNDSTFLNLKKKEIWGDMNAIKNCLAWIRK